MQVTLWHNPRCGKSRQTLALLQEHGAEVTVRRYLDDPPSEEEIRRALKALGCEARGLMRKKEATYRELGLGSEALTEADLVEAMVKHPRLIERPLAWVGERAALGRPPEQVLPLLQG